MQFKETSNIISKRYHLNIADSNQTAKMLIGDHGKFKNIEQLEDYLDELEELGEIES